MYVIVPSKVVKHDQPKAIGLYKTHRLQRMRETKLR